MEEKINRKRILARKDERYTKYIDSKAERSQIFGEKEEGTLEVTNFD